jgi:drug/metabolite transporter (DMT)-like permease
LTLSTSGGSPSVRGRSPDFNTVLGYLEVAAAAAIWGSVGIFARFIELPPPAIAFFRVGFAALVLGAYFLLTGQTDRLRFGRNGPLLLLMGIFLAMDWLLFFYAFRLTTIASAVLAAYTAPVFVAVLAPFLIGERLEPSTPAALVLAFAGVALVAVGNAAGGGTPNLVGVLCGLGTGVFYALRTVASKAIAGRLPVTTVTFYNCVVAAVILAPALGQIQGIPSPLTWGLLFTLGAVHTALGIGLYYGGVGRVKAQSAAILTYVEPLVAVVLAAVIFKEIPGWTTYLGGALILAGGTVTVFGTTWAEQLVWRVFGLKEPPVRR